MDANMVGTCSPAGIDPEPAIRRSGAFPNPFTGKVTFSFEPAADPVRIEIYTSTGRLLLVSGPAIEDGLQNSVQNSVQNGVQNSVQNSVQNGVQNGVQVDLGHLGPGMYLYRLVSSGRVVGSGRIIRE
jgi:hypothetical protein